MPDADQVRWVSVELYPVQLPGTVPQPRLTARGEDAAVIALVLDWLRTAPIRFGSAEGASVLHNTPALTFGLTDGRRLYVLPALDCQHVVLGTTCKQAENQVLMSDGSRRWRLNSPELSDWLAGGWRAYFRLGDYAERDAIIASP